MISVIGSANMDLIARVPRLPVPGETVLSSGMLQAPGGKGANQAVAAARAGSEVSFVGRVGDDSLGAALVESLRRAGVSTDHVTLTEGTPSGVALIAVDDGGENSIVVVPGANAMVSDADVDRAAETIARSSAVVLQLEIPLGTVARAADLAHRQGVRVILNPAPAVSIDHSMLEMVDVLVPNEEELARLSGMGPPTDPATAARLLIDLGVGAIVVTLGGQGAIVVTRDSEATVPAFSVRPVDTTGAGDAFVGNLAHALEEGLALLEAARFAAAAAALSVQRPGAQPSMPTAAETAGLLRASADHV